MPAFKKFGPGDQVDNVLVLEPQYELASGSTGGWKGSPNGSGSISLYGGMRRSPAGVFRDIRYQSIYPGISQFGQVVRGEPLTASVNFAWMTSETLNLTQRSSTRWGEEHWDTVMRLYQDYQPRDPDYITGSYDYYSVYFQRDSSNIVAHKYGAMWKPSASFTFEAWVKPLLSADANHDLTIWNVNSTLWFGVTGSSNRLAFSSSYGIGTASLGLTLGEWNHVSVRGDGASGSFTINLGDAGSFPLSPITGANSFTGSHGFGNAENPGNGEIGDFDDASPPGIQIGMIGSRRGAFHGYMNEVRLWQTTRTPAQLSSSAFSRLTGSPDLQIYLPFNDGPIAWGTPYGDLGAGGAVTVAGSGVLDYANSGSVTIQSFAVMVGFDDRIGPSWQPCDNVLFYPNKSIARSDARVTGLRVLSIPSAFYGRQIAPGSVVLTDQTYNTGSIGIRRTLIDDGRGGLYVSGSMYSGSIAIGDNYDGVGWNKVGNVFYGEGLIVIKDPSLVDFASVPAGTLSPNDTLQLTFRGQTRIPVKTLMCRIDHGEFNASNNPTFYTTGSAGERVRRHFSGSIRATTVGLYNSDRELVGVARLADPVRIRPRDRINIKLRMDF